MSAPGSTAAPQTFDGPYASTSHAERSGNPTNSGSYQSYSSLPPGLPPPQVDQSYDRFGATSGPMASLPVPQPYYLSNTGPYPAYGTYNSQFGAPVVHNPPPPFPVESYEQQQQYQSQYQYQSLQPSSSTSQPQSSYQQAQQHQYQPQLSPPPHFAPNTPLPAPLPQHPANLGTTPPMFTASQPDYPQASPQPFTGPTSSPPAHISLPLEHGSPNIDLRRYAIHLQLTDGGQIEFLAVPPPASSTLAFTSSAGQPATGLWGGLPTNSAPKEIVLWRSPLPKWTSNGIETQVVVPETLVLPALGRR